MTEDKPSSVTEDRRGGTVRRVIAWIGIILLALVAVILVLGLIPVSTDDLDSSPDPATSYDEALQRFEAIRREEAPIVNDASGSLLLTHDGPTEEVFVLIHGITNSPRQWQELGEMLFDKGHNVLILRMPHHGLKSHSVSELKALKAEALQEHADGAIDLASGLGDKITVVGISGGGTVATWIAQHREDVDRVLALSPFYGVPQIPASLNTFLMNLASRLPNVSLQNPAEPLREWVYRGEATRGVAAFMRLGRNVFASAENGAPAASTLYFVTTVVDDTADNDYTTDLVGIWTEAGAEVAAFEFAAAEDIPHNSVDPAADPARKALVYAKIMAMLGE